MRLGDLLKEQGISLPCRPAPPPLDGQSPAHSVKEKCFKLWLGISFKGTEDRHNPRTMPPLTFEEKKWVNSMVKDNPSFLSEWHGQFLAHGKEGSLAAITSEFEPGIREVSHPSCEWSHRGGARPAWASKVQTDFRRAQKQEGDAYAHPDTPTPAQRHANPFANIKRR